jgi:NAD(P)-dependent dehydrogenase (short-subunit alcohol dehydrogenase family)
VAQALDEITDMAQSQGITVEEAEAQFLKTMRPTSLINRFASTDEVANMVIYVCSEHASATTGAALRIDGGVVGMWPDSIGQDRTISR